MRSLRHAASALLLLATSLGASCIGGGRGGGGDGDGDGLAGVWQYQEGSFSFVNCYTLSTTVDLTRSGFQIVDEAGALVRINPDGCRFTIVPTTARHASGVSGEQCTVNGTDPFGDPLTTRYEVETLLLELSPNDSSRMIEVFSITSEQTSTLGTVNCEISGDNTLDRAP